MINSNNNYPFKPPVVNGLSPKNWEKVLDKYSRLGYTHKGGGKFVNKVNGMEIRAYQTSTGGIGVQVIRTES